MGLNLWGGDDIGPFGIPSPTPPQPGSALGAEIERGRGIALGSILGKEGIFFGDYCKPNSAVGK